MTDLFDTAFRVARGLPPAKQEAIARWILDLSGETRSPVELTPGEEAAIAASEAAEERGNYATEEEVRAIWAKHGL